MKALDFPYITCDQVRMIDRGPYHYYPESGEVYDAIGNFIGFGSISDGKMIVTPESTTIHESNQKTKNA